MNLPVASDDTLDVVIVPRAHDLGDRFEVRRALPSAQRRMVGPFVFLDQMGPAQFQRGRGLDVRPHPHIGLATLTYLYEGEIAHRDSLGSNQVIRPGDLNWMTAGRGIVHSERSPAEARPNGAVLSGLQCWVALPKSHEETQPSFVHMPGAELPVAEGEGVTARVIVGSLFGKTSPVATLSPLFYVDLTLAPGAKVELPADYTERAIYVVNGRVDLGADGLHDSNRLLVLKPGAPIVIANPGPEPTRMMLLGGEPFDEPRYLAWNFVSSSADRLRKAKEDWKNGRFKPVPGETEFIPYPDK